MYKLLNVHFILYRTQNMAIWKRENFRGKKKIKTISSRMEKKSLETHVSAIVMVKLWWL